VLGFLHTTPPVAADPVTFDLQSHRGGRGETTEESLRAFAKSIEVGVSTLELDVVITADRQPLVWHDPRIESTKCSDTDPAFPDDPRYPYVGELVRNLTPGEIVGQVMMARDRLGDWPAPSLPTAADAGAEAKGSEGRLVTNIVMMGMGEPLYNFEAVRDALLIVADGEGIGISKRRITLSTSGVVPNIARTGAEIGVMLAVSL